jgi:hypothetical protein
MVGPDLASGSAGLDVDMDLAFGARGTTRFGRPLRGGGSGAAFRQASGTPGAPPPGQPFRPTRDLSAKREAYDEGAPSGSLARPGAAAASGSVRPARPITVAFKDPGVGRKTMLASLANLDLVG